MFILFVNTELDTFIQCLLYACFDYTMFEEGMLYIMVESRQSTKKVAENRKKDTNSAKNRKREVVETRKSEKKATES